MRFDIISRKRASVVRPPLAVLAVLLAILGSPIALGQMTPSEHASPRIEDHRPPAVNDGMAPGTAKPAGPAGMMDMMKPAPSAPASGATVGGCCGAKGGKPFYPAMMDLPALTPEARKAIRTEAIARLGTGGEMLSAAQLDLHHAQSTNDLARAHNALATTREGLSLAQSGTGALQALNQSQPPRRIALTWFKNETAITPNGDMIMDGGFRDLSWLHVAAMLILAAALGTILLMRWQRLRRIKALADRLTPNSDGKQAPGVTGSAAPILQPATPVTSSTPAVQRPWKGVLRIKAIFDETPTVKTFRLMDANLGPFPFVFLPGQYATITSEIDGQKVRRSYTISSSPTQRDYVELTVKREDYGLESRHLHDHAKTGDLLEITAPSGKFFFTGAEAKGIVLIAGGVGITPMMSVLRDLTDRSYEHKIHLICAANTPQDLIFREEIAYLARRHSNVTIASIVSKADDDWTGPVGFITPDFIVKCAPDIAERRIHLCGPPPMMDAVKYALAQLKVPPDQIKTEDFAPPKGGPVPANEPEEPPTEAAAAAPPTAVGAAAAEAPSAQATVEFSTSGKSGTLAPDQSVLEAAEAIGVVIDFECRVGTCGRCKVPLSKGTVTMEVEDALSAEEKAGGTILACQAKSSGNLVVAA